MSTASLHRRSPASTFFLLAYTAFKALRWAEGQRGRQVPLSLRLGLFSSLARFSSHTRASRGLEHHSLFLLSMRRHDHPSNLSSKQQVTSFMAGRNIPSTARHPATPFLFFVHRLEERCRLHSELLPHFHKAFRLQGRFRRRVIVASLASSQGLVMKPSQPSLSAVFWTHPLCCCCWDLDNVYSSQCKSCALQTLKRHDPGPLT